MGSKSKAQRTDTLLNATLIILEVWALTRRFLEVGFSMYSYYTQCSNTLAMVAAIGCVVANVRGGDGRRAHRLKFWACATQLMTFVIATFVLAPIICLTGGNGYYEMFLTGSMPVTHLMGPLLTLVTYELFEADPLPTARDSRRAMLPTFAYAMVAYACNYLRVFEGPYPFFLVWNMPPWQTLVWFVVLLAVAFVLAQVPRLVAVRLAKHGGMAERNR